MDCGRPARGARCDPHQREWERARRQRATQRVAYSDPAYKAIRRRLLTGRPICHLCGIPGADSLDHVIPLSRGGTNEMSNLRPAHLACNIAKHNRPLEEL